MPQVGAINLTLVNQVLQLPEEVQETYLKTGRLPPSSYLSDVNLEPPTGVVLHRVEQPDSGRVSMFRATTEGAALRPH
jgi:hypothetical protein